MINKKWKTRSLTKKRRIDQSWLRNFKLRLWLKRKLFKILKTLLLVNLTSSYITKAQALTLKRLKNCNRKKQSLFPGIKGNCPQSNLNQWLTYLRMSNKSSRTIEISFLKWPFRQNKKIKLIQSQNFPTAVLKKVTTISGSKGKNVA